MSQETVKDDTPRHKEKPIIVDRYVNGMAVPLAFEGISASATAHERGGAVYVDQALRARAIEILQQQGFSVTEDEKV